MKSYRYATHKNYGNRLFHINVHFSDGTYFLYCYLQKETVRSKTYSSKTKRKGNTILLGGIGKEEDIRLHKRIPRKIKKRLMGLEIIKKSKLIQRRLHPSFIKRFQLFQITNV
jgi:hypothetical protein